MRESGTDNKMRESGTDKKMRDSGTDIKMRDSIETFNGSEILSKDMFIVLTSGISGISC